MPEHDDARTGVSGVATPNVLPANDSFRDDSSCIRRILQLGEPFYGRHERRASSFSRR